MYFPIIKNWRKNMQIMWMRTKTNDQQGKGIKAGYKKKGVHGWELQRWIILSW